MVQSRLEPIELGRSIEHFVEREAEREPPPELLSPFVSREWELVTVDALVTSGKWFAAGWRRDIAGTPWFLVFGSSGGHTEVVTVFPTTDEPLAKFKNSSEIVRPDDPFFDKVDKVNQELMGQVR